ncbi:hypothetical protein DL546_002671 [Coniochaeta pulveracea]|uniref:Yeast cell wall synthesis Kre9/Knh1-like N-terminal domain-containing protein n=1 Tax=Coniochaeta pulveracea TaxID=177199 RepID=A0A420YDU4_9PEZI|nr:hypothetical protein DL546_002671 [Coniochaeta pulveracea]
MRFTLTTAVLAFASSVLAADPTDGFDVISKPGQDEQVPAGATYEVTWEPNSNYTGTISLSLLGGASQGTLQNLGPLATGIDGAAGKYSWEVEKSLGKDKVYGLILALESNKDVFQYSHPFAIKAAAGGASDNASSSSAAPTTTSGSSSSAPSTTDAPSASETVSPTGASPITTDASTATGSSTATVSPVKSMTTSTTTGSASSTANASSTPVAVAGNSAVAKGASSVALLGGLAMAIFGF